MAGADEKKSSDRKHCRTALPVDERHLRLMLASVKDYAILTTDSDGIVTNWNAGATNIFGHAPEEIIGRHCSLLWPPGDQERGDAAREMEVARKEGVAQDRRWHQCKNGSRFFADGLLWPMYDENGTPAGFTKICRDVTEERAAEQELADARRQIARSLEAERSRLEELFQRSPSFMASLRGRDLVFDMVNERYYELIGRRELIGKPLRDALPELEDQAFIESTIRVYETGEAFTGQGARIFLQRRPGEPPAERYIDFVCQATRGPDGTIDGLFVQGVDVTERELAQLGLQRLAAIIESSDDAIIGIDLDGIVMNWNPGAERIFGYTAAEMIGSPVHPIIPPEARGGLEATLQQIARGERVGNIETRRVDKSGKQFDVSVTVSPVRNTAGDIVGASKVIHDISRRKRVEAKLRTSEQRFRQLADSMPSIVWTARPDGFVDYYNGRWYEYTGLPEGALGNETWDLVLHPDDKELTYTKWAQAVRTGELYEIEFRFRRASDGAFRWHLGRAVPMRETDGKISRWFGTSTDVHDRKLLEQQNERLLESERAARSEAERASRMKDEFLATVSHELRTPLHAISGWAQILRETKAEKYLEQGLEVIERNARAQTRIIEDLLDMSRIISGKVHLNVQAVDLPATVRAAIETIRPAAEAKGIRLLAPSDRTAPPLSGDPDRLKQVFWNLLSNGVKFTPRGGEIRVRWELVGDDFAISFTDTGEGIEGEFLPHVFGRFRQADASSNREHAGLGLGLAIVKQIVELHGGTVRVESPGAGRGSTFTVTLPLTPIRPKTEEPPRRAPGSQSPPLDPDACVKLGGLKLLIVDDEPDARALVERLVLECDAETRVAGSADEAFALFKEAPPDVLVTDIGMPGEDGYSLLRRVRALGPERGGDTPAIALTAYARDEDRAHALRSGFQKHLSKPVDGPALLTAISDAASRNPSSQ